MLGWDWYSICSAHYKRQEECTICQQGRWVGPIKQWKSRRWYRAHHVVNGQWEKKP